MIRLTVDDILRFHYQIEGNNLLRSEELLESAVNAPFQTFGGEYLYKTIGEQAAHLMYGLNKNHCFIDGNKRISIHAMLVFLKANRINIRYIQEELVDLTLNVASGKYNVNYIVEWINKRTL